MLERIDSWKLLTLKLKGIKDWFDGREGSTGLESVMIPVFYIVFLGIMMSLLVEIVDKSGTAGTPWYKKYLLLMYILCRHQKLSGSIVIKLLTEVNLCISFLCLL